MPSATRLTDGQSDFCGGVDSGRVPTIANAFALTGVKANQLAWAANATMRGGGVMCRPGWHKLDIAFTGTTEPIFNGGTAIFQGGVMYEPPNGFPYMIIALSGGLYRVRVDTNNSVDDISIPGDLNSATRPQSWFCQGEEFMFVQNGQDVCQIWDGTTMRRAIPGNSEVPVGTCMDYYMGRLWVANGRTYVASDIVGGPTGTLPYQFRDAITRFTEAGFLAGGGSLIVPTNAGNITAMKHTANMDTALGQGQLFVFTRKAVYATAVPVTRADWYASTEPLQKVVQVRYGATSQDSVCHVNGDLFYRSPDGIRSLLMAIRYFNSWGNVPISRNERRITEREDRALTRYASGIEFDNRVWQTCLPTITPQGVTWNGVLPLDFDLISSLAEREPPAWEGMYAGLKVLKLLEADYGGLQRAFAICRSDNGEIQVWELTTSERFDSTDGRIQWAIETPSYVWKDPFQAKELVGATLFVDKSFGKVDYEVFFRPDQHPCWSFWHAWQDCSVRNPCEDPATPDCYVIQNYREQYHPYTLPVPPDTYNSVMQTEMRRGYQFQLLIRVTGWSRIRGLLVYAEAKEQHPYEWIVG